MMATLPIEKLVHEVYREFPTAYTLGTYNRRKIAGTDTWSQHSWANAEDVGVGTLALGDDVFDWLKVHKTRLGLRSFGITRRPALWRKASHYDHLHVEGLPTMRGVPPLPGGTLPPEDDDMKQGDTGDDVRRYQDALRDLGYPVTSDGQYGPATAAATAGAQADIGFTVDGGVASSAFIASLFARQLARIHGHNGYSPANHVHPPLPHGHTATTTITEA